MADFVNNMVSRLVLALNAKDITSLGFVDFPRVTSAQVLSQNDLGGLANLEVNAISLKLCLGITVVCQVEDKVGLDGWLCVVSIAGVGGDALTIVARTVEVLVGDGWNLMVVMRRVSGVLRGNWLLGMRMWSPWVGILGSLWLLSMRIWSPWVAVLRSLWCLRIVIPWTWVSWVSVGIMRCFISFLGLISTSLAILLSVLLRVSTIRCKVVTSVVWVVLSEVILVIAGLMSLVSVLWPLRVCVA